MKSKKLEYVWVVSCRRSSVIIVCKSSRIAKTYSYKCCEIKKHEIKTY